MSRGLDLLNWKLIGILKDQFSGFSRSLDLRGPLLASEENLVGNSLSPTMRIFGFAPLQIARMNALMRAYLCKLEDLNKEFVQYLRSGKRLLYKGTLGIVVDSIICTLGVKSIVMP